MSVLAVSTIGFSLALEAISLEAGRLPVVKKAGYSEAGILFSMSTKRVLEATAGGDADGNKLWGSIE